MTGTADWIANKRLTETDNYMKPAFSSDINSAVDMDLIKGTPDFNGKRSTVAGTDSATDKVHSDGGRTEGEASS